MREANTSSGKLPHDRSGYSIDLSGMQGKLLIVTNLRSGFLKVARPCPARNQDGRDVSLGGRNTSAKLTVGATMRAARCFSAITS